MVEHHLDLGTQSERIYTRHYRPGGGSGASGKPLQTLSNNGGAGWPHQNASGSHGTVQVKHGDAQTFWLWNEPVSGGTAVTLDDDGDLFSDSSSHTATLTTTVDSSSYDSGANATTVSLTTTDDWSGYTLLDCLAHGSDDGTGSGYNILRYWDAGTDDWRLLIDGNVESTFAATYPISIPTKAQRLDGILRDYATWQSATESTTTITLRYGIFNSTDIDAGWITFNNGADWYEINTYTAASRTLVLSASLDEEAISADTCY